MRAFFDLLLGVPFASSSLVVALVRFFGLDLGVTSLGVFGLATAPAPEAEPYLSFSVASTCRLSDRNVSDISNSINKLKSTYTNFPDLYKPVDLATSS